MSNTFKLCPTFFPLPLATGLCNHRLKTWGDTQGRIQGGDHPLPIKPTKITLFTLILYNSENNIRDVRSFCRPLFCHSCVVKYRPTSFLLQ